MYKYEYSLKFTLQEEKKPKKCNFEGNEMPENIHNWAEYLSKSQ